jgi:hypothetical protein
MLFVRLGSYAWGVEFDTAPTTPLMSAESAMKELMYQFIVRNERRGEVFTFEELPNVGTLK